MVNFFYRRDGSATVFDVNDPSNDFVSANRGANGPSERYNTSGNCGTGCIVGAAVGGVVFVSIVLLLSIWLIRRSRRMREEREALGVDKNLPVGPSGNQAKSIIKTHKLPAPPPKDAAAAAASPTEKYLPGVPSAEYNPYSGAAATAPSSAETTDHASPIDTSGTQPLLPDRDAKVNQNRVAFNA